jgi:hypothetical protein
MQVPTTSCTRKYKCFKPENDTEVTGNVILICSSSSSISLFKKKYTLSKIYFTKTTDSKSMACVWMERKSLKVLISMI